MRKTYFLLLTVILLLSAAGCGEKAVEIPTSIDGQRFCSVIQGFNFLPTRQSVAGYITYMKIRGVEFAADLEVINPAAYPSKMNVFGVVSWLTWRENPTDPVVFAAQVSGDNKNKLAALGSTDLTGADIEFSFDLYFYDKQKGAYTKFLTSNEKILKGSLYKQEEHLLYLMSTDSRGDVTTPENFNFQLGVGPEGAGQEIIVGGEAKGWGEQ